MNEVKTGSGEASEDSNVRRGFWSRLFRRNGSETEVAANQQEATCSLDSDSQSEACGQAAQEVQSVSRNTSLADEITVSSDVNSVPVLAPAECSSTRGSDAEYQQRVASLAKAIWENEGCPEGRDEEHWFRAERQLRQG